MPTRERLPRQKITPELEQTNDAPESENTARVLRNLEEGLVIDEHALDEALLRQPDLLYRVSKKLVQLTSRRDSAKQLLTETEAQVDAKIRHDAAVAGDKITEKEVASEKVLNVDVRKAEREILELSYQVAQFAALKEAFQQRSYMLRELVALYTMNYYSGQEENKAINQARNADSQFAKRRMSVERRNMK